jgi:hypothetical protein
MSQYGIPLSESGLLPQKRVWANFRQSRLTELGRRPGVSSAPPHFSSSPEYVDNCAEKCVTLLDKSVLAFSRVVRQWPDLVNAGRSPPIDNVSQLPGVSNEINLQFPLAIDHELGRRIQNAGALTFVRIVQVEFASR